MYCGAGGAAYGYHLAGFGDITGIDNRPQPRYPYRFIEADALEYLAAHGGEYDFIHASPPCQGYSIMRNLPWLRGRDYPLLIMATIELLDRLGKPYALENVMGARRGAPGLSRRGLDAHGLAAGWLCGSMFSLPFYRHRLFATNWFWLAPGHPAHRQVIGGQRARSTLTHWQGNGAQSAGVGIGHAAGWRLAAEAMGIDWMRRDELTQAIPPAYTQYVGQCWLHTAREDHILT